MLTSHAHAGAKEVLLKGAPTFFLLPGVGISIPREVRVGNAPAPPNGGLEALPDL
ncbi:hypothetical protein KSB_51480 [Ktedonobacter robiniae]|uniref:Uncharacterized protein n=1 Tax=Ktedonobacter robiniae TaxID=2778365 RepID=A0ABQ3UVG4_9CHLR|nr:hypothetical protein KSB_51480 [Ktedonobacter robiniae]